MNTNTMTLTSSERQHYRNRDELISVLKDYVHHGYRIAITFTFKHDLFETHSVNQLEFIQKKMDQFFTAINDDHFLSTKKNGFRSQYRENKERRRKNANKYHNEKRNREKGNLEFSFIGFSEHEESNYHVHGLMRAAAGSLIDDQFLIRARVIWRDLVSTGDVDIARNATHNNHKHQIRFGERYAYVHDSVGFIRVKDMGKEAFSAYIIKESNIISRNRSGEFIFAGGL